MAGGFFGDKITSNGIADLRSKFKWLDYQDQGAEYLTPDYYVKLLKPYIFDRCSDVGLFQRYLSAIGQRGIDRVLEIGPGTGRGTFALLDAIKPRELALVDRSRRMLSYLDQQLRGQHCGRLIPMDAVEFLRGSSERYDLVFSLWSLSHAIHQTLLNIGFSSGRMRVLEALRNLFNNVLAPDGHFFLIHFDSTSDEQTIALRQRSRVFTFLEVGKHSPSKLMIDDVLLELEREGVIMSETKHLVGEPIIYSNLEEALEIFMNFHIEGCFNNSPEIASVMAELTRDLNCFRLSDGRLQITPACFLYTCRRSAR